MLHVPKSLPRQTSKKTKVWLTADQHYFHGKILIYEPGRPWTDVSAMNRDMTAYHNDLVGPKDHTIHIGDICFGHKEHLADILLALNGHHYLMDGSHDRALEEYVKWEDKPKELEAKVTILPKLFEFTYNGHKISLCHYKMEKFWCSHYGEFHFYAHSHGKSPHAGRAMDVGVDTNNFRPYLLEDALAMLSKIPIPPISRS